jgi:hypothetical protein
MSYQMSISGEVLTVRFNGQIGQIAIQQFAHEIRANLDHQGKPVAVILDLTQLPILNPTLKAAVCRMLQHHSVSKVGICGASVGHQQDAAEIALVLGRTRPVTISDTEIDVKAEMGLAPQGKKLNGMLKYVRENRA